MSEVDYSKYGKSGLTVADLDALKDDVIGASTTNYVKTIYAVCKMAFIFMYIFVRSKLIEDEILFAKHEQQQKQINEDRDQVDIDMPKV